MEWKAAMWLQQLYYQLPGLGMHWKGTKGVITNQHRTSVQHATQRRTQDCLKLHGMTLLTAQGCYCGRHWDGRFYPSEFRVTSFLKWAVLFLVRAYAEDTDQRSANHGMEGNTRTLWNGSQNVSANWNYHPHSREAWGLPHGDSWASEGTFLHRWLAYWRINCRGHSAPTWVFGWSVRLPWTLDIFYRWATMLIDEGAYCKL